MIPVTFRPLRWDLPRTPDDARRAAPFRAGFRSTLDLLDRELTHLDGRDVVVELDIAEHELRRDGWPRATARPIFPGVRIAFASLHGPLVYATDSCLHWQDNLRCIALGLEALRAVDRYGVTRRGEQYRGWAELPAAPDASSVLGAAEVILRAARMPDVALGAIVDATGDARRDAVRRAVRYTHPDTGGSSAAFIAVQAAARTLGVPL